MYSFWKCILFELYLVLIIQIFCVPLKENSKGIQT
jgi:hypothetical protein